MRARVYVRDCIENDPSMVVEMGSPPSAGDVLDSRTYGPCEVIEVVRTPEDRSQDALVVLRLRLPSESL
jgi:hypothetical protein